MSSLLYTGGTMINYPFRFDEDAARDALRYVLQLNGLQMGQALLMKALYHAEKLHISNYGRPIFGGYIRRMKHGPVPTGVRTLVHSPANGLVELSDDRKTVRLLHVSDRFENLSDSDRECLREGHTRFSGITFAEMERRAHDEDLTWRAGKLNTLVSIDELLIELPEADRAEMVAYYTDAH